ncbi:Two-component response regulator [Candidatus Burkholderia humilis]|nr:Two-component response regulator [Candidatus Burkholderia humilis]
MRVKKRATRVLVVDDNSNGADAFAAFLSSGQAKVLAVYGGAAAIAAACVWKPDVVLLDISMPEIDGFYVAKALRGNARTSTAIIVALTAHDESFVKQNANKEDFDAYCQKGLMLESLTSLLGSLTGTSGNALSAAS